MTDYSVILKYSNNSEYHMNFNNKLNFIIGDSATGKTSIILHEDDIVLTEATLNGTDVMDDYIAVSTNIFAEIKTALESSAKLVIIDETDELLRVLKSVDINKLVKHKLIIIISRDIEAIGASEVNRVSTGTNNFYGLKANGLNHITVPYFNFNRISKVERVFTEDSASGKYFMERLCDKEIITPLFGKEQLDKYKYKNTDLVLVDLCGLKQMVYQLWFMYVQVGVSVINCHSLEWLILNTNKFDGRCNLTLDDYPEKAKSLERYLTSLLNEESKRLYNRTYSKGDEEYFDWLFANGKEALLKGTQYDYLLNCFNDSSNRALSIAERAKLLSGG